MKAAKAFGEDSDTSHFLDHLPLYSQVLVNLFSNFRRCDRSLAVHQRSSTHGDGHVLSPIYIPVFSQPITTCDQLGSV